MCVGNEEKKYTKKQIDANVQMLRASCVLQPQAKLLQQLDIDACLSRHECIEVRA